MAPTAGAAVEMPSVDADQGAGPPGSVGADCSHYSIAHPLQVARLVCHGLAPSLPGFSILPITWPRTSLSIQSRVSGGSPT